VKLDSIEFGVDRPEEQAMGNSTNKTGDVNGRWTIEGKGKLLGIDPGFHGFFR
jgi:hypothetical protein